MPGQKYPKDENLRLILSTDQDHWLRQRIKKYKNFAWMMSILLAVSTSWTVAYTSGAISLNDDPGCFSFIGEAPEHQAMHEEFLSLGMKPCPPGSPEGPADLTVNWYDVEIVATMIPLIVILVAFLGLLRNLFLIRKFKGYLNDHQAFLKKYNRQ